MLIGTISGVGMWSFVVSLPAVQADFGVTRAEASLPYTLMMIGFAGGTVLMGRVVDRFGVVATLLIGSITIGLGYIGAGLSPTLTVFAAFHVLLGFGSSCGFGPLVSDISHWFEKRRGIAVGLCASGNYFAGAIWPPVIQYFLTHSFLGNAAGWRPTHIGIGIFCALAVFPLTFLLRRRAPAVHGTAAATQANAGSLGLSPGTLQLLLSIAGVCCCVAMSMPQVHLVAYCGDLGYGVAVGAEMLSAMMIAGIISRIGSGVIADYIGGLRTLLLGSFLQGVALLLYALFDGFYSLYIISILFGLFQGGIVPSYAIIVREYFSAREAGARLGVILMSTLFGMAFGGWVSGLIFDLTGSYRAAFLNGLAWNLLNVAIAVWLISRASGGRRRLATA